MREQFDRAGLKVLVESPEVGVHLATSPDGFRFIFFQGHPEYDTISLLKEYKREVLRYAAGELTEFPPFVDAYFDVSSKAIFREYHQRLVEAVAAAEPLPEFPDSLVISSLDNTWHDTAEAVVGNWMGLVYQLTHRDRRKPFMDGIDLQNPLNL